MSGSFDAFAQCFALPHRVETFEGINILNSLDDIEAVFIGVRRHLVGKSVTEVVRNCLSAEFDGADRVKFSHETRMMNGMRLVQESFPCLSIVERIDGRWLLTSSSYAIVNAPQHVSALMGRLGQSSQTGS